MTYKNMALPVFRMHCLSSQDVASIIPNAPPSHSAIRKQSSNNVPNTTRNFEHSRALVLRNAVIEVLQERDAIACAQAMAMLGAEYGANPLLSAFERLCKKLRSSI
jgi:hypothetical protein